MAIASTSFGSAGDGSGNALAVEWLDLTSVRVEPLADLESQRARDWTHPGLEEKVVHVRPVLASHLQDVAEALGGEQRSPDPGALEDRVDGDG